MNIFKSIQSILNKLFNRKEDTMILEKQAESLLDALRDLVNTVNTMVENVSAMTKPSAEDKEFIANSDEHKKPTKKELTDLKKTAKAKAGTVLKEMGKEKLSELLSRFGSVKFSELLNEADVFNDFIKKADEMIAEKTPGSKDDDDLLGEGPEEKEHTLEDVKALLLKVNNAPTLGRNATREILSDFGVARLPELKKEKFAQAVEKIEATLKDAGVE